MLKPTYIEAHDLPEVWYRALWELFKREKQREYMVQQGSFEYQHKRKELDFLFCTVENPSSRNMVPIIPEGLNIPAPTNSIYIERYFIEYLLGVEMKPGESYTYGTRIHVSLENVIRLLKYTPGTNQACIEIAQPDDITLEEPPCLRLIDCRVQNNKLHFFVYFRSWDLYAGLPQNLGGLQLLKEYMADRIGVEDGMIIASSKGAHVYDYAWNYVKELVRYEGAE